MATATVTITKKHTVRPARPAPVSVVRLSAIDMMWREMPHNRRLLFYKMRDVEEYASLVQRLKASLSEALAIFWPLAGRLRQSSDGRLEVDCNDAGAVLIEARVDGVTWEDLQESDFGYRQPLFTELVPWINPSDYMIQPPFSVQISSLDCGSLVVGAAHSHVVCDGTSLWHFLTSWAEIARGEPRLSLPPVHTRELLYVNEPSAEKACLRLEMVEDEEGLPGAAEKEELKIFSFSKDDGRKLKARAGGKRSTYETMCAHVWRRVSAARRNSPDKQLCFTHIVNMRGRVRPRFPEGYFGNALMWATTTATAGELEVEDLEATANRMRASIDGCDGKAFEGWLHWLEVHGRQRPLDCCLAIHGGRLRASSSVVFPIAQVDFGWGPPAAVRCAAIELPGKIIFFPGPEGIPSIELSLALPSPFIRRLSQDPVFHLTE